MCTVIVGCVMDDFMVIICTVGINKLWDRGCIVGHRQVSQSYLWDVVILEQHILEFNVLVFQQPVGKVVGFSKALLVIISQAMRH